MHGHEPSLAPAMPLVYDARKALAWLGAKHAATLLVGESPSPLSNPDLDLDPDPDPYLDPDPDPDPNPTPKP